MTEAVGILAAVTVALTYWKGVAWMQSKMDARAREEAVEHRKRYEALSAKYDALEAKFDALERTLSKFETQRFTFLSVGTLGVEELDRENYAGARMHWVNALKLAGGQA